MRHAALATLLVVAATAAADVPDTEVWLEASGHFRAGLVAVGVGVVDDGKPVPPVGVGAVNLHRQAFAVNACHRDLRLDLDWTPANASLETDPFSAALPYSFRAELLGPDGSERGIEAPAPASYSLGVVDAPGTYVLDLYLRTGGEVDWDARVRGLKAPGEPTCVETVRVAEVEANPPGTDAGHEWVELWNPGIYAVDVSGWTLHATHGAPAALTLEAGTVLAPDARHVVAFADGQAVDNEDEVLVLLDEDGFERDRTPALSDAANDARTHQLAGATWAFAPATPGSAP